jgi:multiple antibiotic resistance protein
MAFGKTGSAFGVVKGSPAVVPLAIPKTVGPGVIAIVIALGHEASGWLFAEDVIIFILLSLITALLLIGAERINAIFGETAMSIVSRIFGLLLLAISVSSILTSLSNFFPAWTVP